MLEFLKLASKIRVPSETELLTRAETETVRTQFKAEAETSV